MDLRNSSVDLNEYKISNKARYKYEYVHLTWDSQIETNRQNRFKLLNV